MLEIKAITMKSDDYYRVQVTANEEMKAAWLAILNEDCDDDEKMTFEQAIEESGYGFNNSGDLCVEIEIDLSEETSNVVYYFDDYEDLDVKITNEELRQCINFINKWKDVLPDNSELCLGDCEWYDSIPNNIPWK